MLNPAVKGGSATLRGPNPGKGAHLPAAQSRAPHCWPRTSGGCTQRGHRSGREAVPGSSECHFPHEPPTHPGHGGTAPNTSISWVNKSVPALGVSRTQVLPHAEQQGCGRGQGKVISTPLGQQKEAIKNQSTCWSAAILGQRRGGKVLRGPHGRGEHPWGQEHREGDPAGAAPAGSRGGEAGAVLGAGEPLREHPPPPCSSGDQGGLGAGAGRAPGAG